MCGIYGIWHRDGKTVDREALQQATRSLRHRGPDDEGYLLVNTRSGAVYPCAGSDTVSHMQLPLLQSVDAPDCDLAFGFRRLAILDLSPAGHQPMATPDRHHWIVFNGEIYNFIELRAELMQYGHTFRSGSDTEVILAAYQQWGTSCLNHFNGMWAFALWDSDKKYLFLARDRFGVKPLYYASVRQTFTFASEIKALVGAHGIPFVPDEYAIYDYLANGALPSTRGGKTFFTDVYSLPPSNWSDVHCEHMALQRYWETPAPNPHPHTSDSRAVVEAYRSLFLDAVRLQLRADVSVGTCLSGGVDSSAIVCTVNQLMQQGGIAIEQVGSHQKTFSAVYDTDAPYNERPYIERVLASTSVAPTFTIPSAERLWQDVERLVWHQDEPFLSTSIFAQWCVMSAVREQGVTVLLDGQGADETLAGYRPFVSFLSDSLRRGAIGQMLADALAIQARTGMKAAALLNRAFVMQLPDSLLHRLRRGLNTKRMSKEALSSDFAAHFRDESSTGWWSDYYRSLHTQLSIQMEETSLPNLLRYEDRNSMAFGIEARVPFLDHRLVEFAFADAAQWRIHKGWTKWVLRTAMEGIMPAAISWRKTKIGFETPEDSWLSQWMKRDPSFFNTGALSSQYLKNDTVQHMLATGTATVDDRWRLWRWINLELWLQRWHNA